jgi:thiol-disulfide isomerase/thioredoxin
MSPVPAFAGTRAGVDRLPKLTVLSREYCHLCEELIGALKQFQARYAFEIEVIDVDQHPRLEEKWGDKVPVLLDGEREICRYYLDLEAVDARLARMK